MRKRRRLAQRATGAKVTDQSAARRNAAVEAHQAVLDARASTRRPSTYAAARATSIPAGGRTRIVIGPPRSRTTYPRATVVVVGDARRAAGAARTLRIGRCGSIR